MRSIHLLVFLITTNLLKAQQPTFTLSGHIKDCDSHKEIQGATVRLIVSDGRCLETLTNKDGKYYFDNSIILSNRQYILTTQTEMGLGYFNCAEKYKFETFDSIPPKVIIKDFCFSKKEGR